MIQTFAEEGHFAQVSMYLIFWYPVREESLYHSCWRPGSLTHQMMTSSNGNIFRVTSPLCGEFIGHRWIPLTEASDAELFSLICAWINGWVNNHEAGHLSSHGIGKVGYTVPLFSRGWVSPNCALSVSRNETKSNHINDDATYDVSSQQQIALLVHQRYI